MDIKKMLNSSRMKSDKLEVKKTHVEKNESDKPNKRQCLAIGGVAKERLGFPDTKKSK